MGAFREVSRLEAFSDAVFAFSATLLVVSLEVPRTLAELTRDLTGFISFGVSFFALVAIWSVHRAFFRRYDLESGLIVGLNSVLLLVILFYVYPLKFLTRGLAFSLGLAPHATGGIIDSPDDLATLFMLYSAGFTMIFLCVAMMYLLAGRRSVALGLSSFRRHEAMMLSRHYGIFALMGAVSIGLARGHVGLRFGLPGFVYALLGPLCFAHGVWSERRAPAPDA